MKGRDLLSSVISCSGNVIGANKSSTRNIINDI